MKSDLMVLGKRRKSKKQIRNIVSIWETLRNRILLIFDVFLINTYCVIMSFVNFLFSCGKVTQVNGVLMSSLK